MIALGTDRVEVIDPFGAAGDRAMPFLARALDPRQVEAELRRLPSLCPATAHLRVTGIRATRHKPGRRCLIEYDIEIASADGRRARRRVVGKARARGPDWRTYRFQQQLWNQGFRVCGGTTRTTEIEETSEKAAEKSPVSAVGSVVSRGSSVAVPEPLGLVPRFRMWLQEWVPGRRVAELMAGPAGIWLARRAAEAIHQLHRAPIDPPRSHTLDDELGILRARLAWVAGAEPRWRKRLDALMNACCLAAERIHDEMSVPIHRDFYGDQLLVDGSRCVLVDLDLLSWGHAALDAGNFLGHLVEQALRLHGDPEALRDPAQAFLTRFVELSGDRARIQVAVYTILTLARHVFLTTQFPERRHSTEAVLRLTEQRLGL